MKLSEDLKETYDGMIEDGTGFYDVIKIIGNAVYEAEQLESRIAALEAAIEKHKAHTDAVGFMLFHDELLYAELLESK